MTEPTTQRWARQLREAREAWCADCGHEWDGHVEITEEADDGETTTRVECVAGCECTGFVLVSQTSLARDTGLAQQTISLAERGVGSIDTFERLAHHFGLTLEAGRTGGG